MRRWASKVHENQKGTCGIDKIYFPVDIQIEVSLILLFVVNILFTAAQRGPYLFDWTRESSTGGLWCLFFAIKMTDGFYEETRT